MEKVRISAKIDDNVLKESERLLEKANCKNISEYIRKAIETYNNISSILTTKNGNR